MRQTRLTPVFALAVASALFTVGCTPDDPQPTVTATVSTTAPTPSETRQADPDPSPSASETLLPDADPPAEADRFPADREPDTSEASTDARLSPVDLRFGVHDGL